VEKKKEYKSAKNTDPVVKNENLSAHLDFAEKAGLENIKFRLQNTETLAKEAASLLTILLTGIGGSMVLAVKVFEEKIVSTLTVGAISLTIWLMLVAVVLVVFCILTTELQPPTNDPLNLFQKNFSLESIRIAELKNLDGRIKKITLRNNLVAKWLDRTRKLAISSPLVFATAYFIGLGGALTCSLRSGAG
jgi:hypothetical protein